MSNEHPQIPDSADELLHQIDDARSEKASPETIDKVRIFAAELTRNYPVQHETHDELDDYKEAPVLLVDGREGRVRSYIHQADRLTDTLVEFAETTKNIHSEPYQLSTTYFLGEHGAESSTKNRSLSEIAEENSEDEYAGMSMEEAEEKAKLEAENIKNEVSSGLGAVTNEELINVLRLLETAEILAVT